MDIYYCFLIDSFYDKKIIFTFITTNYLNQIPYTELKISKIIISSG